MNGLGLGYNLRDHLAVQGKTPGAVTPEATSAANATRQGSGSRRRRSRWGVQRGP